MSKIPVGATIAHAYSFTFKNFLNILGAMWLPTVAFLVVVIAAGMVGMNMGVDPMDPTTLMPAIPLFLIAYVFGLLCSLMPWIAVTEKALGLRDGPIFYYFSLGKPLWRLLGGILLLILVFLGGAIVIGVVAALIAGILGVAAFGGGGDTTQSLGMLALAIPVLIIVLYFFIIYAMVRLTFLLIPATVAENRMGLWRSWKLMGGNFWRAFLILLCIFIPLVIVEVVVMMLLHAPMVPPTDESPEAALRFITEVIDFYIAAWYWILPIFLAIAVFFTGLFIGAQAFAYQALAAGNVPRDTGG